MPAGCRLERGCQGEIALVMNYIARGYVSLSEEYHHPRSPLSLPSLSTMHARAHERGFLSFFFSPQVFSVLFFSSYFLSRSSRWRIILVNGHRARVATQILYVEISVDDHFSLFYIILYVHVTVSFVYCFAVVPTPVTPGILIKLL